MPGKRISSHQIRLYMDSQKQGKSQRSSAAIAGFSERSSYRVENQSFNPAIKNRSWKTRSDPFESVWQNDLVPLLEVEPRLEARTLIEELQRRYEGQYPDKLLRTLQRRVRQWKANYGPEKDVIFRQKHPPGQQGISDFTDANKLSVTVCGEPLSHLLYHYRLSFSGWEYAQVILGGESYTALAEGMQNAFWTSGGVPETHRTDSLSAAYKNCSDKLKEEFTESYRQLCSHYGTEPTRNNKGVSHENGSIESSHGRLKNQIDQSLMLRGSRDFNSLDMYKAFIREIIMRQNKRVEKTFAEEQAFLKTLPKRKTCDYTEERIRVTSSSTVTLKKVIYSVPSRLIGMMLKVHVFDDRLECYVDGDHILTLTRLRKNKQHLHHIDYHHVIGTLVRKPQAFRSYVYRDDLFPTFAFRQTWEQLDNQLDGRQACREFVKILNEAARPEGEEKVNNYLENCLARGVLPTSEAVRALFQNHQTSAPILKDSYPEPRDYDELLRSQRGGCL